MNFTLHQFKTDVFHFRGRLLLLWLSLAVRPVMNALHSLAGEGMGITGFFFTLFQVLFALSIILGAIQADSFAGDSAAWLCRPIRRRHLFWAKSSFIIVCLVIPWFIMWCIDWMICGYSWRLGWNAAEELLLFSLTGILMVAVLAALTTGIARFFLAGGIVVGAVFAWNVLIDVLTRMKILTQAGSGIYETQRSNSALLVAWLVLAACALAAWFWQARAARPRQAIAWLALGLLAVPIITTVWSKNLLTSKLRPAVSLTLSQPGTNSDNLPGQWLSSEFLLQGVPDRQVAVVQSLNDQIMLNGGRKMITVPWAPHNTSANRIRPSQSYASDQYLTVVQDYFPSNTIWFRDDYYSGIGSLFDHDWFRKNYPHLAPPLKMDGDLTVDLFNVKKVADLPLHFASVVALPGVRVTIQNVYVAGGVINITIDESCARLMFDRNVDTSYSDLNQQASCTYVLYHPGSGEAFLIDRNNNPQEFLPPFLGGEEQRAVNLRFPYPALREKLAGITAADWMKEAHLMVFAPVYDGTSSALAFHQEDFKVAETYKASALHQREIDADTRMVQQATLPADHTPAQLETYLDQVLRNIPEYMGKSQIKSFREKLSVIGTNDLPALLNRLPLPALTENSVVFPVVEKMIAREQLPELRAALQRDDNVIDVFRNRHWEADARDILIAELPDHRRNMSADELNIVAQAKDPSTYVELRWRFIHLAYGHENVIQALEECPGFDVTGAVREAWQNARLSDHVNADLAAIAARYDLPDALNLAVAYVINAQRDDSDQRRVLGRLSSLTGYTGATNNALPWLVANLDHFQYDAAQQRYTLGAAQ